MPFDCGPAASAHPGLCLYPAPEGQARKPLVGACLALEACCLSPASWCTP